MAITVSTSASKTSKPAVLKAMLDVAQTSLDITPRKLEILQTLASHGKIAVAFDGTAPVGWLIAEPLGSSIEELGMAYVLPAYRRQAVLKKLIEALEDRTKTQVFATYAPEIITYMKTNYGFSESNLAAIGRATKGRFLTKRLSPRVLRSIGGRLKSKPVYYALRKAVR